MVEDVAPGETTLLIEVFFTIPGTPLLARNTKSLTVNETHVLDVSVFVVLKSSSYTSIQINSICHYLTSRNSFLAIETLYFSFLPRNLLPSELARTYL